MHFERNCLSVRPINRGAVRKIADAIQQAAGPRGEALYRREAPDSVTIVCGLQVRDDHGRLPHDVALGTVREWLQRWGRLGPWDFELTIVACPRSSTDDVPPSRWLAVTISEVAVGLPPGCDTEQTCPLTGLPPGRPTRAATESGELRPASSM